MNDNNSEIRFYESLHNLNHLETTVKVFTGKSEEWLDWKNRMLNFADSRRVAKYFIKDLINLVSLLKEGEEVLEVLILNLKEVLYLSLNKITFFSKIYFNILNSFKANKIKNKGFKALLISNS